MAYWADSDPLWLSLTPTQKAAAMALLEANSGDLRGAVNVLGAMVNRAEAEGAPLGQHVSGKIYQPTIEDTQRQRLAQVVKSPAFSSLTALADKRLRGEAPDWAQGATHFLAPEKTMLGLEAKEPQKYRSWRGWTGYDPETGSYEGVVFRDNSHAFLTPGTSSKKTAAPKATAPIENTEIRNLVASAPAQKEGMDMNFASLFSKGVPSMPSAADGADMRNLFGSLAAFGQGGQGGGGQSQGGNSDMQLAQSAMQNAAGGNEEGQGQQMVKKPFDMAQLAQMLQQAGRLGTYRPRGGGMGGVA